MDKIKVLLVEDEETLAMIIKDTLEGQNFIINTATDGEEGLRLLFDLRPDVLVADVMMPTFFGFILKDKISGIKFSFCASFAGYRADYFQSIAFPRSKSDGTARIVYLCIRIISAVGGYIASGNSGIFL